MTKSIQAVLFIFFTSTLVLACEDDCRFDPDCGGGIGGHCHGDHDCDDGFCCESGNCGGGMCTYECGNDRDCPDDMLCEHDVCFFDCRSDRDCAEGMSCEHGNTVCEWE